MVTPLSTPYVFRIRYRKCILRNLPSPLIHCPLTSDKPSFQTPSILSTLPHCIDHVEDLRSPLPMAIRVAPQAQSTSPSFSPSAPQVEPSSRRSRSPHETMSSALSYSRRLAWWVRKPTSLVHTLGAPPGPTAESSLSQYNCQTPRMRSASPPAESVWCPMELPSHQLNLLFSSRHQPYLL